MSEEINDDYDLIKQAKLFQSEAGNRTFKLEEDVNPGPSVEVDTRLDNEGVVSSHDHDEFKTAGEIQELIDNSMVKRPQNTIDITGDETGITLDTSDLSFKFYQMTVIARLNGGTIASATIDFQIAPTDTSGDFVTKKTITFTGAGNDSIIWELPSNFVRYDLSNFVKTGSANIDIHIEDLI